MAIVTIILTLQKEALRTNTNTTRHDKQLRLLGVGRREPVSPTHQLRVGLLFVQDYDDLVHCAPPLGALRNSCRSFRCAQRGWTTGGHGLRPISHFRQKICEFDSMHTLTTT